MFLLIAIAIVLALIVWYRKYFAYWQKHGIPSYRNTLFSANLMDFIRMKTNFFLHMKTIYDDPRFQNEAVVGCYTVQPVLLIKEPELIKAILIRDFDYFHDRHAFSDPSVDPIGGMSLSFARYDIWKDMRTKLSPVFSSGKMKNFYPLIQKVGEELERQLNIRGNEFTMEMKQFFGRYTIDVTASTIFGIESNCLANPNDEFGIQISKLGAFDLKRAFNQLIIFALPKLRRLFRVQLFYEESNRFIKNLITQVIEKREKSDEKRNDLIDVLVHLKADALKAGESMEIIMNKLAGQAAILFAGGYETSSSTLAACLYELAKNPYIQTRLIAVIQCAFAKENGKISFEEINNIDYLNMVIDETLRKYPALPLLDREYKKPNGKSVAFSLKPYYNYELQEGMPVYISPYALHYDPKFWPNPEAFDPERFSPENKTLIDPMTYLPFGNGPHNCIGSRLGLLQLRVGLCYFLRHHSVTIYNKTTLLPEFDKKATMLQISGGTNLKIRRESFDCSSMLL